MRYLVLILALTLPSLGVAECPLKVGVTTALSGSLASIGTSVKNGVRMADREWDKNSCVKFIFEDDSFTPRNAVSAARKLLDIDHVQGLIVFGAGGALAVAPLAEAVHVPMIAIAIDRSIVTGRQYVMKHWPTTEVETAELVGEVKRRGYKSVAVIATTQDAMLGLRQVFVDKVSVPILIDESFLPVESDFRAIVPRIKAQNVEAVYLVLLPPQLALFAKQLRAIGYTGELFGAHQLENLDEVRAAEGALNGAWFVSGGDAAADPTFARRYRAIFKEDLHHGAYNGYDVAKMFILGQAEKDLNLYLHNLRDFSGVMGTYSTTAENDFTLPVSLKVVTARGFEALPKR
jgi:branched-chain amino acid transport system substrate-binding protein